MTEQSIQTYLEFIGCLRRFKYAADSILQDDDLTFPQFLLLLELRAGSSQMGDLADKMRCDASNITVIVDRLEARGMIAREVVAADRRVKKLVITTLGRQVTDKVLPLLACKVGMHNLDERQQTELQAMLHKLG